MTEHPQVVRTKGDAPEQYPDWEDSWEEDEDEDKSSAGTDLAII